MTSPTISAAHLSANTKGGKNETDKEQGQDCLCSDVIKTSFAAEISTEKFVSIEAAITTKGEHTVLVFTRGSFLVGFLAVLGLIGLRHLSNELT